VCETVVAAEQWRNILAIEMSRTTTKPGIALGVVNDAALDEVLMPLTRLIEADFGAEYWVEVAAGRTQKGYLETKSNDQESSFLWTYVDHISFLLPNSNFESGPIRQWRHKARIANG
jgi:hypothetical protein